MYFLHIKGTDMLDSKFFFETKDELNKRLDEFLPEEVLPWTKDKKDGVIYDQSVRYPLRKLELEKWLELHMDIIEIDIDKCKKYQKMYLGR